MRFLKTFLLLIALQSVLVLPSLGQSPAASQFGLPPPPPPVTTATPNAEIEILKAEAANQRYYNDKILATANNYIVACTSAFIFVLGVTGFGAWRLRVGDKKMLVEGMQKRHAELLADFDKKLAKHRKEVDVELVKLFGAIDAAAAKLSAEIDVRVTEVGKLAISNVDDLSKALSKKIAELNFKVTHWEATRQLTAANHALGLLTLSQCVVIALEDNNVYQANNAVEEMEGIVNNLADNAFNETGIHLETIASNLSDLPPEIAAQGQRVMQRINQMSRHIELN